MSALAEEITPGQPPGPEGDGLAGMDAPDWQADGRGRRFVKAPAGHPRAEKGGTIYRRGDETVAEALERTSRPDQDKKPPPKPRKKSMPKREAVDLKTIEEALGQVFQAPGQVAGMLLQDEWIMAHFMIRGPELARALCNASEHNPWLRKKLIELSTGGAAAMQLQAIVMLMIASASYAVPPFAYLLGWNDKIPAFVQVSVLGGPIPVKARPAPVAHPIVDVQQGGDISYGEGSAQTA